jgi:hypothetical protein
MAIQYTVREISTSSITVDYADGSWAIVPIHYGMTKQEIEDNIGNFQPSANKFNSLDEIPFTVGESGEASSLAERDLIRKKEIERKIEAENNQILTYADFRLDNYPPIGDQLDALYWARQGNDDFIKKIDQEIQTVKEQYPKDMDPITLVEYNQIIKGAANDVLG